MVQGAPGPLPVVLSYTRNPSIHLRSFPCLLCRLRTVEDHSPISLLRARYREEGQALLLSTIIAQTLLSGDQIVAKCNCLDVYFVLFGWPC